MQDFNHIQCICCDKIISQLYTELYTDLEYDTPSQKMWNKGGVFRIEMGYGSELDNDTFYMGICDSCIKDKVNKGVIYHSGDTYWADAVRSNIYWRELYKGWEEAMLQNQREIKIIKKDIDEENT